MLNSLADLLDASQKLLSTGEAFEAAQLFNGNILENQGLLENNYQEVCHLFRQILLSGKLACIGGFSNVCLATLARHGGADPRSVPILARYLSDLMLAQPDIGGAILQRFFRAIPGARILSLPELFIIAPNASAEAEETLIGSIENNFNRLTLEQSNYIFSEWHRTCTSWLRNTPNSFLKQETFSRPFANWLYLKLAYGQETEAEYLIAKIPNLQSDDPELERSLRLIADKRSQRLSGGSAFASVNNASKRLKIGVCVSGQLRGYSVAFPTWSHLGLQAHDVEYFVDTWDRAGRKIPIAQHTERSFPPNFSNAFSAAVLALGDERFWSSYSRLAGLFSEGDRVRAGDLKSFYHTDCVKVSSSEDAERRLPGNNLKMLERIWSCSNLARQSATDHDLLVRIRPDKVFTHPLNIDWHHLYEECSKRGVIYADRTSFVLPTGGYCIGDQLAIGVPKDIEGYANTFMRYTDPAQHSAFTRLDGVMSQPFPHTVLAYSVLYNGNLIRALEGAWGSLADPAPIPVQLIYDAVKGDTENRNTQFDEILMNSIQIDLDRSNGSSV